MRAFAPISFALAALALATTALADDHAFTIGTGSPGGNYYSVGGALCRVTNRGETLRCFTQETTGSIDNLYALNLGDIDFAIMQADVQAAAYEGSPRITNSPYSDIRSVFALYDEMLAVAVLADSGITAIADLRGRRVNAGGRNSGTKWTFEAVLQAHGVGANQLPTFQTGGSSEGATDLCEGRIDALAFVTGHPSATLTRLADTCKVTLLPLDSDVIAAMTASQSGYIAAQIPGGLYPSNPAATATIGTKATLVTLESTDDGIVEAVMNGVFSSVENFRQQQIVLGDDSPSRDDLTAPLHPAAQRFFDANARVQ